MKNLSILLQEKLKINSKSKITNEMDEWYITEPYGNLFNTFINKFNKYHFEMGIHEIFIVQLESIKKYIYNDDLDIFEIPDKFKDVDDLISRLRKGERIVINDLKHWYPEEK